MPRRSSTSSDDPYDNLANAIRAVVEDIVARMVDAVKPGGEHNDAVMVSIPEAAKRLGLGTTNLKELLVAGEIESVKVGERRLVPVTALNSFSELNPDQRRQEQKSAKSPRTQRVIADRTESARYSDLHFQVVASR